MEEQSIIQLDQTSHAEMDEDTLQALFAKTSYLLREARKALLQRYAVDSEADLLARIRDGGLDAHPAYEHYLGALILEQNRQQVRAELAAHMGQGAEAELPAISIHLQFRELLEKHYSARLAEPVRMAQDALLLSFDNGLMMEVRYYSRQEYSIIWCWGDAERRLDTAPGTPAAPAGACWPHFSSVLDALLADPLTPHATH